MMVMASNDQVYYTVLVLRTLCLLMVIEDHHEECYAYPQGAFRRKRNKAVLVLRTLYF
jgi:hypothetical protein